MPSDVMRTKLSDYEARQVDEIAAWKSAFPNPCGELFRRAAQPLAKAVESVIPNRLARTAIDAAYKGANASAFDEDLRRKAGVGDVRKLRGKPLEFCDGLARDVGVSAQGVAGAEGFVTGAGGVWTTLVDVPLLFILCLRTIIKTGYCYGYPLDRPSDKAWVMGVLLVALSGTPERRGDYLKRLREIEDLFVEQTEEQVILEEAAALLAQLELFAGVPGVGATTGALLNVLTVRKVEATARRLFQERRLKDDGRVRSIEPLARLENAASAHGWSGALTRAAVGGAYSASFCATFPIHFLTVGLSTAGGRRVRATAAA